MLNERKLQGGWIRHSVSADEDMQQRLAHANDIVGKILYQKKKKTVGKFFTMPFHMCMHTRRHGHAGRHRDTFFQF